MLIVWKLDRLLYLMLSKRAYKGRASRLMSLFHMYVDRQAWSFQYFLVYNNKFILHSFRESLFFVAQSKRDREKKNNADWLSILKYKKYIYREKDKSQFGLRFSSHRHSVHFLCVVVFVLDFPMFIHENDTRMIIIIIIMMTRPVNGSGCLYYCSLLKFENCLLRIIEIYSTAKYWSSYKKFYPFFF